MQHRAITSHILATTQPAVFFDFYGHGDVDVIQYPGGWNGLRRHFDDVVRLTECPLAVRPGQLGQRIAIAILDGAGFDPVHQLLYFFFTEQHIVDEITHVAVDLARRHALGHDDFANHRRPALHHGMTVHGKRCNATLAVTTGTVFRNQRRNVVDIRRWIGRVLLGSRIRHGRTIGGHQRRAYCFTCQQLFDGLLGASH